MARFHRLAVAITLIAASVAARAEAQGRPADARARSDLQFGALLPGVRETVSRLDAARAGQFEIRGVRFAEVEIVFTLPTAMASALGAQLPLEFGPADGGVSNTNTITAAVAFDPRVPLRWRLPGNGRAFLFLGGSAVPGPNQAGGAYAAAIVATVAYTGN